MNKCPSCERDNKDSDKICVYCGRPLTEPPGATKIIPDTDNEEGRPQWGTARFNSRMRLIINERDSKEQHVYYLDENGELLLGRFNPDTGEAPEIDLTLYNAAEKGVSRRHAVITRRETALNLIDLGTPNGTFLNGQRLVANQPRVLRDGDEVRLGYLVLRITFGKT